MPLGVNLGGTAGKNTVRPNLFGTGFFYQEQIPLRVCDAAIDKKDRSVARLPGERRADNEEERACIKK